MFTVPKPFCHADERLALLQIKESFVINNSASSSPDAYPKTESWKPEEENGDCCSWEGVECDDITGHVITLDLGSSYLHGSINSSSSLFRLVHLEWLNLSDNVFNSFEIPSSEVRGTLSKLTSLDLSNCDLRGGFPTGIFDQLPTLQYLNLNSNQKLTGSLPDIQSNHALLELDLANTSLYGELPESIGNFKSLEHLDIWNCHFSGKVPHSLALTLDLSYNNFYGEIPSFLANLTQLAYLSLATNNFVPGTLSWLGSLTNIDYLDLTNTSLTGNIPSSLRNLTKITKLYFKANNLSGQIPPWIGNLTELNEIKFQGNILSGSIPESIFKLENLELLELQLNRLSGILKLGSFLEMKKLYRLQLSGNYLSLHTDASFNGTPPKFKLLGLASCNLSEFPSFLRSQDELEFLELSSNKIHGQIPNWFWNVGTETLRIYLNQNQLHGRIPRSLVHCTELEVLNLGNNRINDSFPYWLGTLPKLRVLILRANKLHGVIGKSQANSDFSRLQIIDLSDNSLRGKLPSQYFSIWNAMKVANTNHSSLYMNANTSTQSREYLWSDYYNYEVTLTNKGIDLKYKNVPDVLSAIDFSSNEFEGEIPETIGNLKLIRMLNLSNNNLIGHITSSLGEISELESLDLSGNKLSGRIPPELAKLNFLEKFNVSYNNLEGPIPREAQFNTFDSDSFKGNSRLCGKPLSEYCGNLVALPPTLLAPQEDEGIGSVLKFDRKIVLIGYGVGLITGMPLHC
ncbi:hypothetical protein PTKIN_Ptkin12aG0004100 [Pterospermum kingtungense]